METKFKIEQLRSDKIIYAVEAVAVNITCLVAMQLFNLLSNLIPAGGIYLYYTGIAIMAFGVIFTLYALIGNLLRLKMIRKLEHKL